MGVWGTSIYSCDMAEDVRDACKAIFAFYDIEQGNQILFDEFKELVEQDWIDNEYASFWYALADWQWKHGMLSDYVKNKTLDLLEGYCGIDEWQDNRRDYEKRIKVLDALKNQLNQTLPPLKKPPKNLPRAKHKPGDIIIFKVSEHIDENNPFWRIENFTAPSAFRSPKFANSKHEDVLGYDARGKYMSLLCIDIDRSLHSKYVDNVFDEYSAYVWYDYLSVEEPTVEMLKSCGFLPRVCVLDKDFNKRITESVDWIYSFILPCEKFKVNKEITSIVKVHDSDEVERYNRLFSQKNYSSYIGFGFELSEMFSSAFKEKNRAELLGEKIDNLLERDVTNPELLTPGELDEVYKRLRAQYQKDFQKMLEDRQE